MSVLVCDNCFAFASPSVVIRSVHRNARGRRERHHVPNSIAQGPPPIFYCRRPPRKTLVERASYNFAGMTHASGSFLQACAKRIFGVAIVGRLNSAGGDSGVRGGKGASFVRLSFGTAQRRRSSERDMFRDFCRRHRNVTLGCLGA